MPHLILLLKDELQGSSVDILTLDEALEKRAVESPGATRVVKLRYLAELGFCGAAWAFGISRTTIERRWTCALAWLHKTLTKNEGP